MFGAKAGKSQNRVDCLIGAGTRVEGNVIFSGGLRIDGHVRGSIIAEDGKSGHAGRFRAGAGGRRDPGAPRGHQWRRLRARQLERIR